MPTALNRLYSQGLFDWVKRHGSKLLVVIGWLLLLILLRQYMTSNNLTFADLTRQLQTLLTGAWYSPLLYMLIYLLRPLILFPASLLTILGGSIFGLGWGFVVVLVAGTLSAMLPYVIGRWFSKGGESQGTTHPRIQGFIDLLRKNPFQAVLVMRLIYLPYDAVSLLVGSLRIAFLPFIAATALGNAAGTLSFVGIGASIEGDLARGDLSLNPTILLFSGAILIFSLIVSRMLNRGRVTSNE
jgi:uncharacterized membrane protein YdjX (TVP38/TMEM64 family)